MSLVTHSRHIHIGNWRVSLPILCHMRTCHDSTHRLHAGRRMGHSRPRPEVRATGRSDHSFEQWLVD